MLRRSQHFSLREASPAVSIDGLIASNQSVRLRSIILTVSGHFPPDGLMGMVFDIAGLPDTRQEKQVGSAELCFTLDGVSSEDLSDHRLIKSTSVF